MTQVQQAKLAAVRKQFPFIDRYIPKEERLLGPPAVTKVDSKLLDAEGGYTLAWSRNRLAAFGADRNMLGESAVAFIAEDGRETGRVRSKDAVPVVEKGSIWRLFGPVTRIKNVEGETIFEALQRIGNPDDIAYIVTVADIFAALRDIRLAPEYRDIVDNSGLVIAIAKVPKGQKLSAWLKEPAAAAESDLKEKIAALDAA